MGCCGLVVTITKFKTCWVRNVLSEKTKINKKASVGLIFKKVYIINRNLSDILR